MVSGCAVLPLGDLEERLKTSKTMKQRALMRARHLISSCSEAKTLPQLGTNLTTSYRSVVSIRTSVVAA